MSSDKVVIIIKQRLRHIGVVSAHWLLSYEKDHKDYSDLFHEKSEKYPRFSYLVEGGHEEF